MTRDLSALTLSDGRVVHVDDTETSGGAYRSGVTVIWHAGSPHTGALHEPLLGFARARGIRLIEVTRPGYGGATPLPGRSVADAASDVLDVADGLGIERFAALGNSGGGPHALATAALAPERVIAVATFASPAPFEDAAAWWNDMAAPGALRAAAQGRASRLAYDESDDADPFVDADRASLRGRWAPLGEDVGRAFELGGVGLIDDDVALTTPWGIDLGEILAPVLLVHGRDDRLIPPAHARLLASAIPDAAIRLRDRAGHIAVLDAVPDALDRLLAL